MPSVYVETTIPSYLAARPSKDALVAERQRLTHQWWARARQTCTLFISQAVVDEINDGDPSQAVRRNAIVQSIRVLNTTAETNALTVFYLSKLNLGSRGLDDIPHFAFAVAYKMDFLVTWNCKHISNIATIKRLTALNREAALHTPKIVTPEEFLLEPMFNKEC